MYVCLQVSVYVNKLVCLCAYIILLMSHEEVEAANVVLVSGLVRGRTSGHHRGLQPLTRHS